MSGKKCEFSVIVFESSVTPPLEPTPGRAPGWPPMWGGRRTAALDVSAAAAVFSVVCVVFVRQVLFIYIDIDQEDNGRILEFFGLKAEECPAVRFIRLGDEMVKYRPQTADLDTATLVKFSQDVLDGKLKVGGAAARHAWGEEGGGSSKRWGLIRLLFSAINFSLVCRSVIVQVKICQFRSFG